VYDSIPTRRAAVSAILMLLILQCLLAGAAIFVNAENLGGVRQTRFDPLVRPSRAADGRWNVDAWAPLDGLVINGGARIGF